MTDERRNEIIKTMSNEDLITLLELLTTGEMATEKRSVALASVKNEILARMK